MPRVRRLIYVAVFALVCVACDGTAPPPVASSSSTTSPPSPSSSPSSPSPSQSPSPPLEPDVHLPADAPATVDVSAGAASLAEDDFAALAPPGATVTFASVLVTPEDPIDQIAFAWRRGDDPFAAETGLAVWQRFDDRPTWRAVYAFTDRPRKGILGIDVRSGDLTDDGVADLLSFEDVGGSGACGTYRVIEPSSGSAEEIFRREACDTAISIAGGDLEVREAVFEPDDPHCCPSAFRVSTLRWSGTRWREVASETRPTG